MADLTTEPVHDFSDGATQLYITKFDISIDNPKKAMRVLSTQLMRDIILETSLCNFTIQEQRYHKACSKLQQRFPYLGYMIGMAEERFGILMAQRYDELRAREMKQQNNIAGLTKPCQN